MRIGTRRNVASASSLRQWRDQLADTAQWNSTPSATSEHFMQRRDTSLDRDELNTNDQSFRRRFCIGIDWGTTFTSISYHAAPQDEDDAYVAQPSDIKTIRNWPDDGTGAAEQVPTEIWYPDTPMKRHSAYEQFDEPADIEPGTYVMEGDEIQSSSEGKATVPDMNYEASIVETEQEGYCDESSTELLWGHSVSYHRYHLNTPRDPKKIVQRPKLMMLSTEYTEKDRRQLRQQVQSLVKGGVLRKYGKRKQPDMRDVRDIITDFLIKVFEHTKQQLQIYEDFTDDCPVEFVLAVPTIWSSQASRILQLSVEAAIRASSFGTLVNNSLVNLFIVPEPEGGVTWMLQSKTMAQRGEVITCLDCGGGTVDGATYEVADSYPPRLGREILDATGNPYTPANDLRTDILLGDNCGGTCVNENFKKLVLSRLRYERYLESNDNTIEAIVNRLAREFEAVDKPRADIATKAIHRYRIDQLRGDQSRDSVGMRGRRRFENNFLLMETQDYEEIYLPVLARVWAVLKKQLDAARQKGSMVKIVFLVGGFAASPSLVNILKAQLIAYEKQCNLPYRIRLIEDKKKSVAAVSAGAVLRALDKASGPKRVIQSSYGFLRREPYAPCNFKGHSYAHPYQDLDNDDWYVDVINYFLNKGQLLPPTQEFKPIKMLHTFAVDNEEPNADDADVASPRMLCQELLFVSDTVTQSHYPFKGVKNRDAQIVGRIVTDVTSLKDRGLLEIVEPEMDDDGELCGNRHYKVEYDLVPMIKGRDLIYEARWPSSDSLSRTENDRRKRRRLEKYEFKQTAQISIAAAFLPGTG
ncbi:uncharacterized protein PAC_18204 [Phialocephala subalpina]|uniref:Hsp70 protein n=1 Tax=Phialocephala subalpina TaxID=576137 RepID=A0A1L7XTI3_9HELO|nr:uncharacterized protein PAC_18204 [Phialocephala subalpina]